MTAPSRSPRPAQTVRRGPRPCRPVRWAARRRTGRTRWVLRIAAGASVLLLTASGVGHAMVTGVEHGIGRVDAFHGMENRPAGGDGLNFLVVGTDGRDKLTPAEKEKYRLGGAPCHCTDTMMLVHLSAARDRASVISLPRDSYAEIPAHRDTATGAQRPARPIKLNAAYAEGGPNLTVRTVEHMTGVHIDHYLEVDFTSFMRTVDAVGGVEICTARPLQDSHTGLNLPAGKAQLNGGQALQYVRSRHVDASADLGRMQRQQRFLAALIERVTSSGVLMNPARFQEVAKTALSSVRADASFTADDLTDLGQAMRGFSASSSEFVSVPLAAQGRRIPGAGSAVVWDPVQSERLFDAVRDDEPLAPHDPAEKQKPRPPVVGVPPNQIRVHVDNGTTRRGLAASVTKQLQATGFVPSGVPGDAAGGQATRTVIAHDPRWDRSARSLATALPGAQLRAVPGQGPVMKVTLGADFTAVRPVRAEEPPAQAGELSAITGDEAVCA